MLPVVRGEAVTRRQILVYALILVALTLLPVADRPVRARSTSSPRSRSAPASSSSRLGSSSTRRGAAALRLYLSSLAYLALLFCAMAVDRVLGA